MMFNRKDPRRLRAVRGVILQLIWVAGNGESLNPSDPFAISRGVLLTALEQMRQLPGETDLTNAVRYCEERGYLEVTWSADRSEFESLRLTTNGIDLVEGTTTDAGVIVPSLR
ncbi:MAG: hypothetical protein HC933_00755 [Pleurocapsa sp. SU_196_0]|nr:hypothetical protein [Pleurocapsa sp. SU_196_0]